MRVSKLTKTIFSLLVFAGLIGFKFLALSNSGDPSTISIDGAEYTIKTDKLKDIKSNGYTLDGVGIFQAVKNVDKKTYVDDAVSINKDGVKYADISVANYGGSTAMVEDCTVIGMKFHYQDEYSMGETIPTYKEALIDGFNPAGMTKDDIKSKIDSKKKVTEDSDTVLKVEDGDYYCTYNFDDSGVVKTVEVGIPGSKLKTAN